MAAARVSPTTFRRLLTRAVVVPAALLGLLVLVCLAQILYLLSAAQWVDHTDQVIARANALLALLVDGETGLRGYLVSGEPVFLEPYHRQEDNIGQEFEGLLALVSDNQHQVERLQALRADQAGWQGYARRVIDLRRGGDARLPFRDAEGKRRMDFMRRQVATFIRVEEGLRDARTGTARRATWAVVGTSLALTLLVGAGLGFFTRRQLLAVSADYRDALAEVEARAESSRKSACRLEALHEIDLAILAATSIPELIRAALRRLERVVPGDDALVVLFDAGGGPGQVIAGDDRGVPVAADELLGPLTGSSSSGLLLGEEADTVTDLAALAARTPLQGRLLQRGRRSCVLVPLRAEGSLFGTLLLADARPAAFADEEQRVTEEVARQLSIAIEQARLREQAQRNAAELERRVVERTRELQEALDNVRRLQGLLPICAWCKKVRDDPDYWHEVEHYVAAHTEARFTHGICPACLQRQLKASQDGSATA